MAWKDFFVWLTRQIMVHLLCLHYDGKCFVQKISRKNCYRQLVQRCSQTFSGQIMCALKTNHIFLPSQPCQNWKEMVGIWKMTSLSQFVASHHQPRKVFWNWLSVVVGRSVQAIAPAWKTKFLVQLSANAMHGDVTAASNSGSHKKMLLIQMEKIKNKNSTLDRH